MARRHRTSTAFWELNGSVKRKKDAPILGKRLPESSSEELRSCWTKVPLKVRWVRLLALGSRRDAMAANGFYVEYDAQTDRGSSGGSLYDVETGHVYELMTYGIPLTRR